MLPDELLISALKDRFLCRDFQIQALATLLGPSIPGPPSLVVHGVESTGKSSITRYTLDVIETPYAIIDSRQCITGRQLLEQTLAEAGEAVEKYHGVDAIAQSLGRCESLSTLQVQLGKLLSGNKRLVLVFDGIDRQREAPPTLIPALARFAETIPSLTVVFIITVPSPRLYHTSGIPHLHFVPYTRDEAIQILSLSPLKIFPDGLDSDVNYTEQEAAEDNAYVWGRFCGVVWDSLAKGAANNIVSFRNTCEALWKPFTAPIVDGTFGTRDFARLLVSRRTIFQSENVLLHRVVATAAEVERSKSKVNHELPYYSKFILCAAYLASYNPVRQDPVFFMKTSEKKRKKRAAGTSAGKASKHRKIPRSMLAPSPFSLERMLAILHAIIPHAVSQSIDILTQIATLASLRLLVRASAASADTVDAGSKWKINCGWEFVAALGRSVGFEIRDYLAGGED